MTGSYSVAERVGQVNMSNKEWHLEIRISARTKEDAIAFLSDNLDELKRTNENMCITNGGGIGSVGGYLVLRKDIKYTYPLDDSTSLFLHHLRALYFESD